MAAPRAIGKDGYQSDPRSRQRECESLERVGERGGAARRVWRSVGSHHWPTSRGERASAGAQAGAVWVAHDLSRVVLYPIGSRDKATEA
jgi:hypothetical protein